MQNRFENYLNNVKKDAIKEQEAIERVTPKNVIPVGDWFYWQGVIKNIELTLEGYKELKGTVCNPPSLN